MRRMIYALLLLLCAAGAEGARRVQTPEFPETNHQIPTTAQPDVGGVAMELSLAVLAVLIAGAVYFGLYRRSRKGLWLVSLVSVVVLGFAWHGCVCPVGSVQNVALSLGDPSPSAIMTLTSPDGVGSYSIGWILATVFALPLLVALVFGRVFCGGACPLGALQELVMVRPARVNKTLDAALGILPWVVLAIAVALAATGAGFVVCQRDPFVTIFRLGGSTRQVILAAAMLALSVFVARPYCRWLCPYGVLLGLASRLSARHLTISPDGSCVSCRLCEGSCPVGAIEGPRPEPRDRRQGRARLAWALLLAPVLLAAGGGLGRLSAEGLMWHHPDVVLYDRLIDEVDETIDVTDMTKETEAYRGVGGALELDLLREKFAAAKQPIQRGMLFAGIFVGLVVALKWIVLCLRRGRDGYRPVASKCVSCGQCFAACPLPDPKGDDHE
ncbi:MAG: 4Fe-4S binding protein [Phycisphaerales bacterium]|jgi:NosR/NirI family transcriptional regulator, nitrous oxide reductase regulator|nr:4Fe-4S binding protein [Phycisphaerales bacterium]MBT7171420.1 4Fe-4S binding protein [Phycisphaerales bacterium]